MSKFTNYIDTTVDELKNKVSWPTWTELQSSTLIVLVTSLIIALMVMVIDLAGSSLIGLIYELAK